jgi:hypothetical protein
MDEASVERLSNYRLLRVAGRRAAVGQPIRLASATYDPEARTVTLVPAVALTTSQTFRLTVIARPPRGVRDVQGRFLDGNGDGRAGGNFTIVLGAGSSRSPLRGRALRRARR